MQFRNFEAHRHHLIAIAILFVFPLVSRAQYYPSPQPEDPANEHILLKQLANHSGEDKIKVLLRLSNLYLNKPLRRDADMKRALAFGVAARDSSIKYHDKKSTDKAQLYIADIYTFQKNMQGAESILPVLNDTVKAELCLNLGYKYGEMDAPTADLEDFWKKGLHFAGEAQRLSAQFHLPLYEILALEDKAYIHMLQSKGEPEKEYLEALKRYRALKYPYLQHTFFALATYYFYTGHPDKAEYYSQEAIKTMKATRDTLMAGDIYVAYGMISYNNGNYQKGYDLGNLGINYLKIHAGLFCLNQRLVFNLPVHALRKMKKYSEAINYVRRMQAEYPAANADDQIADAMLLANIYRDMKDYGRAEESFLAALKINKTQKDTLVFLYKDIGQLYVESKQYAKAKPYLNFVVNRKNNGFPSAVKSHLNYLLFLADSATKDYFSAIKYLSFYNNAREFELRRSQEENAKKLAVQFETRQKEDSIKLLNQKAALDKENLQRANLLKNVTIGGIVLVLIIAGLLYRQSRLRKKNNRTVTLQNNLITHKNEQLENLVTEKEWLLREVHHRVKNNLQIVMSLLYSQSAYLKNKDAIDAIRDSQNRVQAIAIIHQKLYGKSNVATVVMTDYVSELVRYLSSVFDCPRHRINIRQVLEPINLDSAQAVPMGLILNEAITNSIKYAFGADGGEIMIENHLIDSEIIWFRIADNGRGLPDDFNFAETSSLGMEMMRALCKQLGSSFDIRNDSGVVIIMSFKIEHALRPTDKKLTSL